MYSLSRRTLSKRLLRPAAAGPQAAFDVCRSLSSAAASNAFSPLEQVRSHPSPIVSIFCFKFRLQFFFPTISIPKKRMVNAKTMHLKSGFTANRAEMPVAAVLSP